jgi:hypothetical protein
MNSLPETRLCKLCQKSFVKKRNGKGKFCSPRCAGIVAGKARVLKRNPGPISLARDNLLLDEYD